MSNRGLLAGRAPVRSIQSAQIRPANAGQTIKCAVPFVDGCELLMVEWRTVTVSSALSTQRLIINNDTGSNYYWQYGQSADALTSAGESGPVATGIMAGYVDGTNTPYYSSGVLYFPFYKDRANSTRTCCGYAYCPASLTTTQYMHYMGGTWFGFGGTRPSPPITEVRLVTDLSNYGPGSWLKCTVM